MRIVSWNLNGLLSCIRDEAFNPFWELLPDVICCQETKTHQTPTIIDGYNHFWHSGERNGYSGTVCLSLEKPISVFSPDNDDEGRIQAIEFTDFYVVNAYAPNSQQNLQRHCYRLNWDAVFRDFIFSLEQNKPVITCGDFNVPLLDIDIYPGNTRMELERMGYESEEKSNIETILESGFCDAFREKYPCKEGAYTWWSNRLKKRDEDKGWRLDYFFVSEKIKHLINDVTIHSDIFGSDHCPIELDIDL